MYQLLAESSDSTLAAVEIVFGVIGVAMTIWLAYVTSKANKIDALETRLDSKTELLVNEKLANHTNPLKSSIDNLTRELQGVHRRLDEGEADKEKLGEKGQGYAIQIERMASDMKEFMRTTFSTRDDLKKHEESVDKKFDGLTKDTVEVGKLVAVLSNQLKHQDR